MCACLLQEEPSSGILIGYRIDVYDDTRGLIGICYQAQFVTQSCDSNCQTPCAGETCFGPVQLVAKDCSSQNFAGDGHCTTKCQEVAPKFSKVVLVRPFELSLYTPRCFLVFLENSLFLTLEI